MHSTNLLVAALALFASGSLASPDALVRRGKEAQKGDGTQNGGGSGGGSQNGGGGGGQGAFGNCPASNITASVNNPFQLSIFGKDPNAPGVFPDFHGWGAEIFSNEHGRKGVKFTKGVKSPAFTLKDNKLNTETYGDLYLDVFVHEDTGELAVPIFETTAGAPQPQDRLAKVGAVFPQAPKDGDAVWTLSIDDGAWFWFVCETQPSDDSWELLAVHKNNKKMRARGVEPNGSETHQKGNTGGKYKGTGLNDEGGDGGGGGGGGGGGQAPCVHVTIQLVAQDLKCV